MSSVLNEDYKAFLKLQSDKAPHSGWTPITESVDNLSVRLNESTFIQVANGKVSLVGWQMFSLHRFVFGLMKVDIRVAMNHYADYLCSTVHKFNESNDTIKRLRNGTWFDHRWKVYNNLINGTNKNNKNNKKKNIYNELQKYNNMGNYQIKCAI
eukprot:218241_1